MSALEDARLQEFRQALDRAEDDSAVAAPMLAEIVASPADAFAGLSYEAIKDALRIAGVAAEQAPPQHLVVVFSRALEAMQKLNLPAVDYLLTIYNLRASYLQLGEGKQAHSLLQTLFDLTQMAEEVDTATRTALYGLARDFEERGQAATAAVFQRPVWLTLRSREDVDLATRMESAMHYGHLLESAGEANSAIEVYRSTLALLDTETDEAKGKLSMQLHAQLARAHQAAGDLDAAEKAYLTALETAENGSEPDSLDAGIIYHNVAGWWMTHKRTDQFERAVELTERSARITEDAGKAATTDFAASRGQLGILRTALRQYDAARKDFDACFEAFAADPTANPLDIARCRIDEGMLLLTAGHPADALQAFTSAEALRAKGQGATEQESECGLLWSGVAAFEAQDFPLAVSKFKEVVKTRMHVSGSRA